MPEQRPGTPLTAAVLTEALADFLASLGRLCARGAGTHGRRATMRDGGTLIPLPLPTDEPT